MATQKRDLVTGVRNNFIVVSVTAFIIFMYIGAHLAVVQADFIAQGLRGDLFEIIGALPDHIIEKPFALFGGTLGYYGLGLIASLMVMAMEYAKYIAKKNTMWEGVQGTSQWNNDLKGFLYNFVLDPSIINRAENKAVLLIVTAVKSVILSVLLAIGVHFFKPELQKYYWGLPLVCVLLFGVLLLYEKIRPKVKNVGLGKKITTKKLRYGIEKKAKVGWVKRLLCRITPNTIQPEEFQECMENSFIESQEVRLSLNGYWCQRTASSIVFGVPGTGKSRFLVFPNILQANSSMIITDPKGELLENAGNFLKNVKGYKIKVLNLTDLSKTMCYNPLHYIRSQQDIPKVVTTILKNIDGPDKKGGGENGSFWDQATQNIFMAIVAYLYEVYTDKNEFLEDGSENPHWEGHRNLINVVNMLRMTEESEDGESSISDLDCLFAELAETNPESFACRQYASFKTNSGKTALNVLISALVKLNLFDNDEFRSVVCRDDLDLDNIATEKTALFVILPVQDVTFNFLSAILFTQIIDLLYAQGNANHGKLPRPVQFLLDECANLGRIPGLDRILSTCRSYRISIMMVFQTFAQVKNYDKDNYGTLLSAVDSTIFLGSTEQELLKYLSEQLGKQTVNTYSYGNSKSGSSDNRQQVGRPLLDAAEIALMSNADSLITVRNESPFFTPKFHLEEHPNYKYLGNSGHKEGVKYILADEFNNTYDEYAIRKTLVKPYSDPEHTVPRPIDRYIEHDADGNVVYAEFERLNSDGTKEVRQMPKPKALTFDNFSTKLSKKAAKMTEGATTWKDPHCSFMLKGDIANMPKSAKQINEEFEKQQQEEAANAYNPEYWQNLIDTEQMYPVNEADMEDLLDFIREATGGKEFKCTLGDYLAMYQLYEKENGQEEIRKYVDINQLEELIDNMEVVGGYSPDYEFKDEDFDASTFSISVADDEDEFDEEFEEDSDEETEEEPVEEDEEDANNFFTDADLDFAVSFSDIDYDGTDSE